MTISRQAGMGAVGAALLGVAGAALLGGRSRRNHGRARVPRISTPVPARMPSLSLAEPPVGTGVAVKAARRLNRAAGVLALSVLADSAVEHYRGAFHNKAMFAPLVSSALSLGASAHGVAD